jgi:nitroimidazol reductase NimA-like FMN-containing flavoprotein (pyridoxamine 5'-phosphate oxidase superfamily)
VTDERVPADSSVPAAPSARSRVRRLPDRARYDEATIQAVLDDGFVAHLGFVVDGQPYVVPTLHARVGGSVYLHGSPGSRAMRVVGSGAPACLTVTHLDGVVLARSAFHHSVNYRSVVVLGTAAPVTDREEKLRALEAFMERVTPGRWAEVRPPSDHELTLTAVLRLELGEASVKLRTGGPVDDEADLALGAWAGVVPIHPSAGDPVASADLDPAIGPSPAVRALLDRYAQRSG